VQEGAATNNTAPNKAQLPPRLTLALAGGARPVVEGLGVLVAPRARRAAVVRPRRRLLAAVADQVRLGVLLGGTQDVLHLGLGPADVGVLGGGGAVLGHQRRDERHVGRAAEGAPVGVVSQPLGRVADVGVGLLGAERGGVLPLGEDVALEPALGLVGREPEVQGGQQRRRAGQHGVPVIAQGILDVVDLHALGPVAGGLGAGRAVVLAHPRGAPGHLREVALRPVAGVGLEDALGGLPAAMGFGGGRLIGWLG
jgi:hypothetical protein